MIIDLNACHQSLEIKEEVNINKTFQKNHTILSNSERQRNHIAQEKGLINVKMLINSETNTISENYLGKMDVICIHCNAKHFIGEKVTHKKNSLNECCSHGETKLAKPPNFPEDLKLLFEKNIKSQSIFFNVYKVIIVHILLHRLMLIW